MGIYNLYMNKSQKWKECGESNPIRQDQNLLAHHLLFIPTILAPRLGFEPRNDGA